MKIKILEAHDRKLHLIKDQGQNLSQGAEECLKRNPDSLAIQNRCPYVYIFAHPRTHEDGVSQRMLWQPRITRPKPQTNSYCFRAISKTDLLEICWMLPPRELWAQYSKGKVTESDIVAWSIDMFENNRKQLEAKHPEDYSDEKEKEIFMNVLKDRRGTKQDFSEDFSSLQE